MTSVLPRVAVRSSGLAEDGVEASAAGQNETLLGVGSISSVSTVSAVYLQYLQYPQYIYSIYICPVSTISTISTISTQVRGRGAVLGAVLRCWGSLYSVRSVQYR